jgi:hypothetical protein
MDEFEQDNDFAVGTDFIKVRIASVTSGYEVSFKADGSGIINYTEYEYSEKFTHKLNIVEAQAKYPDERTLEKYVTQYFWEKLNHTLSDPLLRDYSDLKTHELEFTIGNRAGFDHIMQLFILTEPDLDNASATKVVVTTAKPHRGAKNGEKKQETQLVKWYYHSQRLEELVGLLMKMHCPVGFDYHYNDGAYDRKSGYNLSPLHLEYDVAEILKVPAREKMAARQELSRWLIERGQNPADYGLDWEKIV